MRYIDRMVSNSLFYQRIKQRCAELGVSLSQASIEAGHSRQWLWTVGQSANPHSKTIHEVAKALKCPPSYFFVDSTSKLLANSMTEGNEE